MTAKELFALPTDDLSRKVAGVDGWKVHPHSTAMMHKDGVDFWIPVDEIHFGKLAYAKSLSLIAEIIWARGWEWSMSRRGGRMEAIFDIRLNKTGTPNLLTLEIRDQRDLARALCALYCAAHPAPPRKEDE